MSDIDDSDLTDIESEEEYTPSQSTSKRHDADGYRIRGALTAPRATSYTTQALHEMLELGDINLEADYQRDIVWHTTKQIGLIDSIFKNFYVPPVIFAVTYASDGSEKRVCIDGKQRLTSIWKFMQGTIPFKDSLTGEKFYYKDNPDRTEKGKQRMLPDRYQKVFRTKQIVCVEYSELTPDSEREIFQRVQLGVALNAAEKLQAIHSPKSIFLRELLADYIHDELETLLDWDTGRAGDFRCIATFVYMIEKWPCKVPSVTVLTKWLQEDKPLDETVCGDASSTLKIFVVLARSRDYRDCFHMEDTKAKKEEKFLKVAPAEFVTSALLINLHKQKLTLAQLSDAIRRMRLDVRGREQDIRLNSRVSNHMLTFMKGLKPSKLKDADGKPASVAGVALYMRSETGKDGRREDSSISASTKKRKARGSSDDDSDYVEPRKSAPTPKKPAVRKTKASSSPAAPSSSKAPLSQSRPAPQLPSKPARAPQPSVQQNSYTSLSSGPQVHPDRLAAIKSARGNAPSYHPPESAPSGPSGRLWDGVPLRLGPGPLASMPAPSYPPSQPRNSLSQDLMSRMHMSYATPASNYPPGGGGLPQPPRSVSDVAFDSRQSASAPNGRDYHARGPNSKVWNQRPW